MTYNFDDLNALSENERSYVMQILNEFSEQGKSDVFDELKYSDFEEIPVDIETFIDNPIYLGAGLMSEGKSTVFPYWREKLKEIFPDNLTTAYNTLILTGSIGLGKSATAVLCLLYLLYRMMCLKDPYKYYGLQPIDKITFSMLNITLDAAKGVAWDKCQQLLQSSEWFMARGTMNKSRVAPTWLPPKGIELIFGSNNNHVIGRALFANFTDEVNFGVGNNVEKQKARQRKMIAQIDARMQSRFMKGTYLPTMNIIASSKDDEQAFLDSYINIKRDNESKTTLIIDEPQWVVRDDKGSPNDPGSFYVAVGNKFLAHELLPVGISEEEADLYRQKGYTLVKIPPGYRESFESNLDKGLTDIVGISTSSSVKYISGVRINEAKVDTYTNPFSRDIIEVGNSPNDTLQYSQFFDLSKVPSSLKSKPLFIHLDMSLSGDKTGIAGVWIMGKKPAVDGEEASKELYYRLAFSVSIAAPKGYQVSFEKNRNFIRWLKRQGFAIKGVSSDTYQSAQIQQDLQKDGFNTQIISVDRVDSQSKICLPYQYLKSAIYERRVEIYRKCNLLTDELIGLERMSGGKIDHTERGINSKDQADAFCGALYLASQHAEQFAYDYGETLDTLLDVSKTTSNAQSIKQQINVEFEEEIKQLLDPLSRRQQAVEQQSNDNMINDNNAKFNDKPSKDVYKPVDFGYGAAVPYKPSAISDGIIFWG